MKKKILTLLLTNLLLLSSCNKKGNDSSSNPTSSVVVFDETLLKQNEGITSIEVINVPSSPIEIGHFKDANIQLKVTYINYKVENYLLDEDFFKGEAISLISTVGKKRITLVFKNNRVTFDVEMIEPKTPVYFTCIFLDRFNNELSKDVVYYLGTAEYKGYSLDDYIEDGYYYSFSSWSKSLNNIHSDTIFKPVYNKRHLFYEKETLSYYPNIPFGSRYTSNQQTHLLMYLGRVNYFPLATSSTYFHNDDIGKKMTLEYNLKMTYPKYFLPLFKNMINKAYSYSKGGIANGSLTGEENLYFKNESFETDDDFIYNNNSSAPHFLRSIDDDSYKGNTRYDGSLSTFTPLSQSFISLVNKYSDKMIEDYIFPTDNKGYYRLVSTCSVDSYMDLTVTKTSDTSYEIKNMRFGIFPIVDTISNIKEYSTNENFDDEKYVPIKIDSNTMYESIKYAYNKAI